jgi:hypothetical protein
MLTTSMMANAHEAAFKTDPYTNPSVFKTKYIEGAVDTDTKVTEGVGHKPPDCIHGRFLEYCFAKPCHMPPPGHRRQWPHVVTR